MDLNRVKVATYLSHQVGQRKDDILLFHQHMENATWVGGLLFSNDLPTWIGDAQAFLVLSRLPARSKKAGERKEKKIGRKSESDEH